MHWQIHIDTGGTFTDCIAHSPQGEIFRYKVLSNSCLRGKLRQQIAPNAIRFAHNWRLSEDIFAAYDFYLTGNNKPIAKVQRIDFQHEILYLNTSVDLPENSDFEISAGEEAPLLAARLATRTPLDTPLPPLTMRLGSTKGTNALLERKGTPVILLITKGFRDLLYIGTQQRPHLFQLDIPEPDLLHAHVIEVEERLDAQGNILQQLHPFEIQRIVNESLKIAKNYQFVSVAIALLHAYRHPIHERQLAAALAQAGFRFISEAHALTSGIKILPRAQTALVNAYLHPTLHDYLQRIQQAQPTDSRLLVMTSAGGLVAAPFFHPKDSLLSGPAGGVIGAAGVAQQLGYTRVLTFDMGGTSTDAAHYNKGFDYQFITKVGHAEMRSPTLSIETVAAGGGSICSFNGQQLIVGPESAGAAPGPACYGAGGPLTITDVNLLLGKLDPDMMGIPVHLEPAQTALRQLQQTLLEKTGEHYTAIELLRGFEAIANEKMADAIRKISVAKGFDPKKYALLAFGGAGGLHACQVAMLLGIQDIVLPYDGGLLSAYGMGQARVERLAEKQVLMLWQNCATSLAAWMEALSQQALQQLQAEGYSMDDIEVTRQWVCLRFEGQDSTLEVPYGNDTLQHFENQYKTLFGHYPQGRSIEVESLKVLAGVKIKPMSPAPSPTKQYTPSPFKMQQNVAVFRWDDLSEGAQIAGPAMLLNLHSSAFIEKGWNAEVVHNQNIIVRQVLKSSASVQARAAVELELFTNRFLAIAEEMGAQLQRTAFSVNVKERLDFSCALLDADANLLVNAPHIPVHLGSLGICARLVLEKYTLRRGDVIITNHPKYGGSHLPDVTLLSAVYSDNGDLIGYVINRAHHAEIGGKRPGSMPPDASTLTEEGVVIAPMYLAQNGILQWPAIEATLQNAAWPTRALTENLADINAALASLRTGEAALRRLTQEHGLEKVQHYMRMLKQSAAHALLKSLQSFDNQTLEAEEYLDDGHRIRVRIHIHGGQMDVDFAGTSGVHPGNLNANISIVYSAVMYVLRLLCAQDMPLNEGLLQHVRLHLPNGLLHPNFSSDDQHSPAVVGGNTEVSQRLVDTLLKAFGVAACSQGTMNNLLFGNARFGYYETIGGGAGAGAGWHGRSAVHQHMTNTRITDPEELEWRYPVRLRRFAIRNHSGGQGRWRGGDGIIRELEFLEPLELTLLSQHRIQAPYGLHGGEPGQPGRQILFRQDGTQESLPGIAGRVVYPGDRLLLETPGGGGYGSTKDK